MRLNYSTAKGHYNWANHSEESYNCYIAVYDDEGKRLKSTNITTEQDESGNGVEEAIEIIKAYSQRVISTAHKEWEDMVEFLEANMEEIERGNDKYELEKLEETVKKEQERINTLRERLCSFTAQTSH